MSGNRLSIVSAAFVIFVAVLGSLLFAVSATAQSASDYRIAPGDRISIAVYGEPDLGFSDLPIPSNGTITYPFLGQVGAAGLTELELSNRIARGLADGYLLQPQVTVAITRYRPIFVGGAVRTPGQQEFTIGLNVERLLALAGGLAENADTGTISIQRAGSGNNTVVSAALSTPVQPGDIVTVGQKEIVSRQLSYFYMEGEVRSPGRYEFSDGLSVQKAIAVAGGFGLRASKRKITITRGESQEILKKVPLDTAIYPGDVISVGTSLF